MKVKLIGANGQEGVYRLAIVDGIVKIEEPTQGWIAASRLEKENKKRVIKAVLGDEGIAHLRRTAS